jgi:hypothetical protein
MDVHAFAYALMQDADAREKEAQDLAATVGKAGDLPDALTVAVRIAEANVLRAVARAALAADAATTK